MGFEPTDPKGQQISSLPRYDRFDTTPYISTAALPGKSERTTGENKLFNSSPQALLSLAPSGFSLGSLPQWTHDFECCTLDLSDNSPCNNSFISSLFSTGNRRDTKERYERRSSAPLCQKVRYSCVFRSTSSTWPTGFRVCPVMTTSIRLHPCFFPRTFFLQNIKKSRRFS